LLKDGQPFVYLVISGPTRNILRQAQDDWMMAPSFAKAMGSKFSFAEASENKQDERIGNGQCRPPLVLSLSKQQRGQKELPQLKLVRNKKLPGTYFGPFIYKGQARSVYRLLLEQLQLYICNKKLPNGCLQFHLGRCAGSCTKTFDKQAYLFRLNLAKQILKGQRKTLERQLKKQIKLHSKKLEFEAAQKLAIILSNLHNIISIIALKITPDYAQLSTQKLPAPTQSTTNFSTLFNLPKEPRIIDCFDISHFQSHALVGSCVRFVDGIAVKSSFRHFAIKTLVKQHDYAALQEIVQRRYRNHQDLPDLIVIDGGKGQLSAVKKIAPPVPVISLAKQEERVFFTGSGKDGIKLDLQSPDGRLLIALRDYAHHFAISYHRLKRKKDL
jgi:excinuclease ABC subunit C